MHHPVSTRFQREFLTFLGVALAVVSAEARAAIRLSVVGTGVLGKPSAAATDSSGVAFPSVTGKFGYGAGALIEIRGQKVGLELGAIYFQRKLTVDFSSVGGLSTDFVFPTLEVPLTLIFHPTRWFFVSVGGYVSGPAGSASGTTSAGTAIGATYSDVFARSINFGTVGGLGLSLPLGRLFALRAEGRYHYAIQNQFNDDTAAAAAGNVWKQHEIQGLVGLTIGGAGGAGGGAGGGGGFRGRR